jgi:hypothetical protein
LSISAVFRRIDLNRAKPGDFRLDWAALLIGVGFTVSLLCLKEPNRSDRPYPCLMRDAGSMLRHGHSSDLAQDIIGFRAICTNGNAYPVLGPAMLKLGVVSDLRHVSTHPPTAFLLVSPIGWMPLDPGSRVWAWLMVACVCASLFCLGCNVPQAIGLGLMCLAWPPVAACLGQLTAVWLLGVSASYRLLIKAPLVSGAALGIAAATKMAPAMLLLLLARHRRAVVGFSIVLVVLLGTLLIFCPSSLTTYLQVIRQTVPRQSGRPDNGSILGRASHHFGRAGRLVVVLFLTAVVMANWKKVRRGSLDGWAVMGYLAVAALPILWMYSLVPLLFLSRWAVLGNWTRRVLFVACVLVIPMLDPSGSPLVLESTILSLGAGLIVTGLMRSTDDAAGSADLGIGEQTGPIPVR